MSDMQPIDPIDECVRLSRELARLQKEYKDTLDEAVAVETERNALKRENAALRQECDELLADLKAQAKQLTQSNRELAQETSLRKIREAIDAARKEAQP